MLDLSRFHSFQAASLGLGSLLPTVLTAQQLPPLDPPRPFAPPVPPPSDPLLQPAPPPDDGGLFSTGFFLQMSFSFIVGLAAGFALKIAFKIALVVGGLLLITLFAFQYAGLIDINWTGMEANYDGFVDWLGAYGSGLKNFMAENVSNTASFTGGLLVGLKF